MTALASSPRKYAHPRGDYTASAAPLWRRGLASALDWGLAGVAYLLLLIPAGALDAIGELFGGAAGRALTVFGHVIAVSAIVVYFTFLLKSGHTMGMRALDIHVRAHDQGREPGLVRSFARALLALVLGVAVVNAYSYLQGRPLLGEFSSFEEAVGDGGRGRGRRPPRAALDARGRRGADAVGPAHGARRSRGHRPRVDA